MSFKSLENAFVNAVVGFFKLSILATATFFMITGAAIMGEVFTTAPLHHTAKILIEHELGIGNYKLKKAFHEYTFIEPDGVWWIELDGGFDIKSLENNRKFTNHNIQAEVPDTSEGIRKDLLLTWGFQTNIDFKRYYAERMQIGSETMCRKAMLRNCQVQVYARDGDKNLFISISIW